ncbi:acyl-CoA dehydrogenase [Kaistia dalseonensis]|uniref:Alkylation response protein AidB-like acyl-CoA dehydrogenase n=1 Tax=Kaistia dalseonensis TaxID=410840 RepID=A0ABU0H1S1_9HYPH|nr:acyl-CoA dehydrogenase family protein [Kaistia dalseonensis]MCX5493688.1 acyl-CoA dehydrogenase [Kaistia dalseonensis]MDQ0436251.1 alkylation response protein AidB-like acyl-CoA dehydrogenase [Kaistia dalseonensis]
MNIQTAALRPDGPSATARPDRATLLARLPALAAEIAKGASERDIDRALPFEAFALFRKSGLGAIRVPVERGGPGGSISDLIEIIATLAAADSNVAHALRSHFNFTEALILSARSPGNDLQLSRVLDGAIFGGAFTELGTAQPGQVTTTLKRQGDSYRLNGKKYYATGTAFSDYASFGALDEDGVFVTALLPLDRPGIHILDDWDGMGQRLTASGGVDLIDVEVFAHEIAPRELVNLVGRHTSALRQLHLVACAGGIIRNVVSDATAYVQKQARAALHSHVQRAIDDPFVQQIIGELSANSFAIDGLIAANAAALDRSASALLADASEADADANILQGALATAKTQIVIAKLALRTAETMFDVGGGSATSRKLNFDRHWRNVRTLLNHNPLLHKARVVGDFTLNGTTDHLKEGRVF